MKNKFTKEESQVYEWGKAIHELKDNPFFEKYQQMIKTIIDSLQNSICDETPNFETADSFHTILTHRAGQVRGLKDILIVQEKYHNFFLKSEEGDYDDESDGPDESEPRSRRQPKRLRR